MNAPAPSPNQPAPSPQRPGPSPYSLASSLHGAASPLQEPASLRHRPASSPKEPAPSPQPTPLSPHTLAAALLAVDPVGLGGAVWRGGHAPARDHWLGGLRALLPEGTPWRRVPLHIADERLLGGLDLAATLQSGRPVVQRGLLAEADGGVAVLAMAERLSPAAAGRLAAVLDTREIVVERDGVAGRHDGRLALVALDEGEGEDERVPASLAERLAFWLAPPVSSGGGQGAATAARLEPHPDGGSPWTPADVARARALLAVVRLDESTVEALCAAALALGIGSVRAPLLACRAARAAAALDGRGEVSTADAALAAGLVLGPRAVRLPDADPEATADAARKAGPDLRRDAGAEAGHADAERGAGADDEAAGADQPADPTGTGDDAGAPTSDRDRPPSPEGSDADASGGTEANLDAVVLAAARAAVPHHLLASLAPGRPLPRSAPAAAAGRAGPATTGGSRGRPAGVQRGAPRGGARLNVIETLRAAAPWQALRWREAATGTVPAAGIQVRREDFRCWRHRQRRRTTSVFVVDASGSSALHRLAEAKGAVELLLAECYVRRDSVALIAFRGRGAELLLPPTRSLVRAKRSLAGLPGGGGTPLAAGLEAAARLVDAIRRRGEVPVVVLLTDGRANIARDGAAGRERAAQDAVVIAGQLRRQGVAALLLDTSPQPQDGARRLAEAMGAHYRPLPHAGAAAVSQAVRSLARDSAAAR